VTRGGRAFRCKRAKLSYERKGSLCEEEFLVQQGVKGAGIVSDTTVVKGSGEVPLTLTAYGTKDKTEWSLEGVAPK
jgi:hypothetical protein